MPCFLSAVDFAHRMKSSLFQKIKRAFAREQKLHPLDHGLAKRWIKQRLLVVFPELRNNPRALETAYQALGLAPRPGTEEGDADTVFEVNLPTGREPGQ
jgi:hypothetical protein